MAFIAFRGMNPFSQLMFSAFVVIVSFLSFVLLSLAIAVPLFGIESILSMGNLSGDGDTLHVLKFFQVVQSFGLFIVPPFILGWFFCGNSLDYLYLKKSLEGSSVILVLMLMFFAAPLINFFGEWNANMHLPEWMAGIENWMKDAEEKAAELTKVFLKVDSPAGLLFNIFMIAVLPAIGEELLFRGVVQRIFSTWTRSHHWGIWISAILFSAMHLQFYGFVPRMLLGALFGYMLVWSGTMWLPIIAHFLNNGFAVVGMYLIDKKLLSPEVETFGSTQGSYYMAFVSLILVAVFLLLFKRQNSEREIIGVDAVVSSTRNQDI